MYSHPVAEQHCLLEDGPLRAPARVEHHFAARENNAGLLPADRDSLDLKACHADLLSASIGDHWHLQVRGEEDGSEGEGVAWGPGAWSHGSMGRMSKRKGGKARDRAPPW
jgi:hypothetical protein